EPLWAAAEQRANHLVCPGWVLDQEEQHRAAVDRDPLEAAERGARRAEARFDLVQPGTELPGEGGRCEGVVHVVEPWEPDPDAPSPLRRDEVERRRFEPLELDRPRGENECRAAVTTGRAAVVAEVADVRCRVGVRCPAAEAVLRVRRVLE